LVVTLQLKSILTPLGKLGIQVISDIHLELPLAPTKFGELLEQEFKVASRELPVVGDALVLAGDIGYPTKTGYKEFILHQADRFETVFVVAGNHEFYRTTYAKAKKDIQAICEIAPKRNVFFMDKVSMLWKGIRVLGCTLWSNVPQQHAKDVASGLTDYKAIKIEDNGKTRAILVEDTNRWHQDELGWLKQEIAKAKTNGEKVVVMTHHAPLMKGTSDPRYEGGAIHSGFATDLKSCMEPPLVAWIYGHTHWSSQQQINGVAVVSNQLGYFMKCEHKLGKTGFSPDFCLFI